MNELFEKLMQMPPDEIIAECGNEDLEDDDFDAPLTAHEATLYFYGKGILSLEEFNTLMSAKIKEIERDLPD